MLLNCKTNKLKTAVQKSINPFKEIAWLAEIRDDFEKDDFHKQQIIQYKYNKEEVFMVYDCYQCPDALTYVYNRDKKIICEFGGFMGKNTCLDFEEKATDKKIIYQDIETANE